MNGEEYDKLCRDIRMCTQKIANEMFTHRRGLIVEKLMEAGVPLTDDDLTLKKGRPKKD